MKKALLTLTVALFLSSASDVVSSAAATDLTGIKMMAEGGALMSQYVLAGMYERGEGTAQDFSEAVEWYKKAAEGGLALAQNRLGEIIRDGQIRTLSKQDAIQWFTRAAKQVTNLRGPI